MSSEGIKQSLLLGWRLKDEIFTHVYTSKLSRAIQTAECILEKNNHAKPEIFKDVRLGERHFGVMEGKPFKLMDDLAKESGLAVHSFTPAGAETLLQVRERAVSFFKDICNQLKTREDKSITTGCSENFKHVTLNNSSPSVLIVTHGGFINEFVRYFVKDLHCQIPEEKRNCVFKFSSNASVSKFLISKKNSHIPRISCVYIYDKQHLEDNSVNKSDL